MFNRVDSMTGSSWRLNKNDSALFRAMFNVHNDEIPEEYFNLYVRYCEYNQEVNIPRLFRKKIR